MKPFVQSFNKLIKKTILKLQNKTNNKFQISAFNKYLITFISLLFFYLFYLSIPVLYDKTWVQSNIESQLLKEFKINFSISSDISYRILPTPHFLIKDSKIFKETGDKKVSLSDIKNLKVFISQKNLFDKKKMILKYLKIDNANFLLSRDDFGLLRDNSNNKFSNKKIEINKSNIFFKDKSNEILTIVKIYKAFLFQDSENLINLFNLKGEVFNIPFSFDYKKKIDSLNNEEFNINAKTLKLNIFNQYNNEKNKLNSGKNIIKFFTSTINTDYEIKNGTLTFNSVNSRVKNAKVDYSGNLSINPFDLNFDINIDNYDLFTKFNNNSIFNELIKTKLLFNDNISVSSSITGTSDLKKSIFQDIKINFNIVNGKINFDKTRLINNKIGFLELANSNLSIENDSLILNTNIIIDINNSEELFSLLQTNKRFRKPIKDIVINLDYDFSNNQILFNTFKIENQEMSDESLRIIEGFNNNNLHKWNKTRRILNAFFKSYEG
tara:strand:- start:956 stop:2440 length:1485 start_codon:yes stop_codon:yes gene_type:complete